MATPIRLIVGLGNPGAQYEATRHNAGFWLADHLADDLKTIFQQEKAFSSWIAKTRIEGEYIVLQKPTTYMNRAGLAVGALVRFYKFSPDQVLVLHDELDLLPGQVKLKHGGGHAGHNGLRDIQAVLGSPDFWRLRIGIGHPRSLGLAQQGADFVLHPPRREDQDAIDGVITRARVAINSMLVGDFTCAARQLQEA